MSSTRSAIAAAPKSTVTAVPLPPLDIDVLLAELLGVGIGNKSIMDAINESQIMQLLQIVRDGFLKQPMLLEINAPVTICGDIHGQYFDLLRLFQIGGWPSKTNYLFLGDYVDRGKNNMETILLLFALRVKYPEQFFLLRGNHELMAINRVYGFFDECVRKYTTKVWYAFQHVFNVMPCAGLVSGRIICMHGGLSGLMKSMDDIRQIPRPIDPSNPYTPIPMDLLWSDPCAMINGWLPNPRGVSVLFGADVVHQSCEWYDIDLICRAHQVVQDGYEFFANKRLVTIFSAPHYCGDFDNLAAIMRVSDNLTCSFEVIKPSYKKNIEVRAKKSKL